jgi:hypothetical protein
VADEKLTRTDKDWEPPEEEAQAVKLWQQRIERAENEPKRKAWCEKLDKYRGYVYGEEHKDASGTELTRTNLVFATLAAMMPHLYAKNPDISVAASPACSKDRLPVVKKFGTTAEAVLGQMFVREGKLKKRAKANIRATETTSYGVLKMVYQSDLQGDPIVLRRIQDAQDNIARIEALARDMKNTVDVQELATKREEHQQQLKGLLSGNEVRMYKGFAIDRVRSENFLILDDSIAEFDEYVDACALGHVVWMTVDQYKTRFGYEPHGATTYNRPNSKEQQVATDPQVSPGDMFVCVIEIWDKDAQVLRTVAKGMKRWCREPFAPKNTPQRWYPFFVLGFNLVEGRWRPISDVELLMNLQDEYNTTRTNFADVRKDAVPVRVFRKAGGLTEDDIKTLSQSRRNRDWIGVEGSPTVPISDDIMQLEGPKIDPNAYDVSLIRNDMDLVVGLSDASRANLIKPKTATEADIMQQALGLRVGERRDTNEDMLSEMAEAALEIALRDLSKAEVQQIAGTDAEWPEGATVEEIFALVEVSVRAGSSGKPNADKEREQWTQLLPVIKETMTAVADLRAQGQFELADAAVELLRETLRRFQERLDVDSLIPPVERGEDGKPVQAAQMQAQIQLQNQQLAAQVQELQQQLEVMQDELAKAKSQEQAKIEKQRFDAEQADKDRASREKMHQADVEARTKTHEGDRVASENVERIRAGVRPLSPEGKEPQLEEAAALNQVAAALVQVAQASAAAQQQSAEQQAQVIAALASATEAIARASMVTRKIDLDIGPDGLPRGGISSPVATH